MDIITDPKLPSLLKMLLWAQNHLDEKAVYPRMNNLSTAMLEDPSVWAARKFSWKISLGLDCSCRNWMMERQNACASITVRLQAVSDVLDATVLQFVCFSFSSILNPCTADMFTRFAFFKVVDYGILYKMIMVLVQVISRLWPNFENVVLLLPPTGLFRKTLERP